MSVTSQVPEPAANAPAERKRRVGFPAETGVAVVLLVSVVWLMLKFPDFRGGANGAVILSRVAELGIVAAGMTLVIATGGIDISVGSIVGCCGVVLGVCSVNRGLPLWASISVALAAGAGCGLVNGLLIARFSVPPIIATLAMLSAARAGAYMLSNSESINGLPDALTDFGYGHWPAIRLPGGDAISVPLSAWVALAVFVLAAVLLKKTTFGRGVLAMGGSREATRLSGVKVRRLEIAVYVISGLLAGLQSIIVTAKQATSVPDAGQYFELSAITAVVLGGTSILGGQATVLGTALGVVTMAVVQNGVQQYKQDAMVGMLVTAVVLIASVEVDRLRRTGLRKKRSNQ